MAPMFFDVFPNRWTPFLESRSQCSVVIRVKQFLGVAEKRFIGWAFSRHIPKIAGICLFSCVLVVQLRGQSIFLGITL